MLDFIWGGLGPNRHPPVHPTNYCPTAYPPPPIHHQTPHNPSLNYYNNFPKTSCYLAPERGSMADNLFNGNLFSSAPSLSYYDSFGNPLPTGKIIQNHGRVSIYKIGVNGKLEVSKNTERGNGINIVFC